jgi:putative lipoic acid-binding regulatory protein
MDKKTQFYKRLKKKLKKDSSFPSKYLFKFIVPSDDHKIMQVENMFNHLGAVVNKTSSKTGKFTSISILVVMKKADDIISKYIEAEKIEGIISL